MHVIQEHDLKSEECHTLISIETYEVYPEFFRQPVCERHERKHIYVCLRRKKLICGECDKDTKDRLGMFTACTTSILNERIINALARFYTSANQSQCIPNCSVHVRQLLYALN